MALMAENKGISTLPLIKYNYQLYGISEKAKRDNVSLNWKQRSNIQSFNKKLYEWTQILLKNSPSILINTIED